MSEIFAIDLQAKEDKVIIVEWQRLGEHQKWMVIYVTFLLSVSSPHTHTHQHIFTNSHLQATHKHEIDRDRAKEERNVLDTQLKMIAINKEMSQ